VGQTVRGEGGRGREGGGGGKEKEGDGKERLAQHTSDFMKVMFLASYSEPITFWHPNMVAMHYIPVGRSC